MNTRKINKRKIILGLATMVLLIALVSVLLVLRSDDETSNNQVELTSETKGDSTDKPNENNEKAPEWPITYNLGEAGSLTVVVNKKHRLPSEYSPNLQSVVGGQLRPEAATALVTMLEDAQSDGILMRIISSYRSYDTQVSTYNRWVEVDGKVQADRSSARPGHSEHQTGLAVDLGTPDANCELLICFGDTAQGQWLAKNAQNYGFIVRYDSDTESVTGYQYEPWHLRYLGIDVAKAVMNSGRTLDQYFDVEAGEY